MAIDRRLTAGALGLALLVAACGGASSTVAPAASQPVPVSPDPSDAAESEAAESEAAASDDDTGPDASFGAGAAGDLEALLPSEAGGLTFTKTSFDGSQLGAAGFGMDAGDLGPVLEANNKSISDVRMAIATSMGGTTPGETAAVIALQVQGMDAAKLVDVATAAEGAGGAATAATVGGKQVLKIEAGGFSTIIYTKDDVLYQVFLATDDVAEAIVAKLP